MLLTPYSCEINQAFEVKQDPDPDTPEWVFEKNPEHNFLEMSQCKGAVAMDGLQNGKIRVKERELNFWQQVFLEPACQVYCLARCIHNASLNEEK